jgi:hypothetical protein
VLGAPKFAADVAALAACIAQAPEKVTAVWLAEQACETVAKLRKPFAAEDERAKRKVRRT